MVGVPGKFKGCETCRKRRVPCDNGRPHCGKCSKNQRKCEGYQRPITFITGTPEGKGRVSIHPKKPTGITKTPPKSRSPRSSPRRSPTNSISPASSISPTNSPPPLPSLPLPLPLSLPPLPPLPLPTTTTRPDPRKLDLVLVEPLLPAWTEGVFVSSGGVDHIIHITALHTKLDAVVVKPEPDFATPKLTASIPLYTPPDVHPVGHDEDFDVAGQCLLSLTPPSAGNSHGGGLCLFLYEQNSGTIQGNNVEDPWHIPQSQLGTVMKRGPEHYRKFPNHHYFARVFRPSALMMALLSRRDTFLSWPEWRIVPWEFHDKTIFDSLLDIISLLPALFERADRILVAAQATISRRLKTQDLLSNLLAIERQFDDWYMLASQGDLDNSFSYWISNVDSSNGQMPFADSFAFRDGVTAVSLLYYWASQILFHQCIDSLNRTLFEPIVDEFPQLYPDLDLDLDLDGRGMLMNPEKYQQTRAIAANICRSLDAALVTTIQPDLLLAPFTVAVDLFESISFMSGGGDGALEMMWCQGFKERVVAKGNYMVGAFQGRKWHELARF